MQPNDLVNKENSTTETNPQVEIAPPVVEEDVNWKKFRQEREADRKRREEAEAMARKSQEEAAALKAAMDSLLNKGAAPESDPDFDSEEVRIQKKVDAALELRDRQIQEQRRKEEQTHLPQRLRQSFGDFDQVCSTDNLDYLEYHHPSLAKAFATMPEGFDKWAAVYDSVKKLIPNTNAKKEADKAERNLNKPGAMAKGGMTQTGDASPQYLDKAKRQANWERMNRIMKGS